MALHNERDDVRAKEAAATDYEDVAKGGNRGACGSHYVRVGRSIGWCFGCGGLGSFPQFRAMAPADEPGSGQLGIRSHLPPMRVWT